MPATRLRRAGDDANRERQEKMITRRRSRGMSSARRTAILQLSVSGHRTHAGWPPPHPTARKRREALDGSAELAAQPDRRSGAYFTSEYIAAAVNSKKATRRKCPRLIAYSTVHEKSRAIWTSATAELNRGSTRQRVPHHAQVARACDSSVASFARVGTRCPHAGQADAVIGPAFRSPARDTAHAAPRRAR